MSSNEPQCVEDRVHRHYRRNVTAIVAFEFFWGLGLPFALFVVFVPAYLNLISAPKLVIGLAASLGAILMPLQLMSDRLAGGMNRRRNCWILYSISALSYVGYGVSSCALPAISDTARMVLFLAAITVFIMAINLGQPMYWSIMTDNCPLRRRGRLLGLRTTGLGVGGLLTVLPAKWVYLHWPAPVNYHIAMLVAGAFFLISTTSVLFIRDQIDPVRLEEYRRPNSTPILREVLGVLGRLWKTPNYRVFIFFIIILAASFSLAPFLVTYAGDILTLPTEQNRIFNVVYLLTCPLAGLSIGTLADRWGYRLAAILLAIFGSATFTLALTAHEINTLLFAYGLYCCAIVTMPTILCNMSVELLPEEKPAHLIAAGNLFTLIAVVLVPAVCGWLIDIFRHLGQVGNGYLTVFIIAIVLAVIAGLGMLFLVQEPRSGRIYIIKILNRP